MRMRGSGPGPWPPASDDENPNVHPGEITHAHGRPPTRLRDEYGFISAADEIAAAATTEEDTDDVS